MILKLNPRDGAMLTAAATLPFRLNRILVPTDFSDCAMKALLYALPLAKKHDAILTLLSVAPIPPYAIGEVSAAECTPICLHASAERELTSFAREVVGEEVKVETMARIGSPAAEIIEAANILPADLIVIATHGRGGLKRVWLGSVAEQVIRHSPCPVLVVRESQREFLVN